MTLNSKQDIKPTPEASPHPLIKRDNKKNKFDNYQNKDINIYKVHRLSDNNSLKNYFKINSVKVIKPCKRKTIINLYFNINYNINSQTPNTEPQRIKFL
jgi:hypothetical protein